ncbi:hypothetical protein MferCBS31731_002119 [Microsporum ferrugineum]
MGSRAPVLPSLPYDILSLILEGLVEDKPSLARLSLTCWALRPLALHFLLDTVDLSSHNRGRLPECEDEIRPEVHADFGDEYRQVNLVPQQRAFLRLMTDRPELALCVKSLKWTLVWIDWEEEALAEIDYELWNVFARFTNVRHLDLASIHNLYYLYDQPFIRRNPPRLFPAVTHLRLVGWMHRGLVDAIIDALDPTTLHTLILDHLQDEGAFPDGTPIAQDIASEHACSLKNRSRGDTYRGSITANLYRRQQVGEAAIFPGPMWTALRTLSARRCTSLVRFECKIPPVHQDIDLRNYYTWFDDTVSFLSNVRQTLRSLTVTFGECPLLTRHSRCGTARNLSRIALHHNIHIVADFLRVLLPALSHPDFSCLGNLYFQGFSILNKAGSYGVQNLELDDVRELSRRCPIAPWETITHTFKTDHCPVFLGYDYYPDRETIQRFRAILEQS